MKNTMFLLGLVFLVSLLLSACGPAVPEVSPNPEPTIVPNIFDHRSFPLPDLGFGQLNFVEFDTTECGRHPTFYNNFIEYTFKNNEVVRLSVETIKFGELAGQKKGVFTFENTSASIPGKELMPGTAVNYMDKGDNYLLAIAICPQGLLPLDPILPK